MKLWKATVVGGGGFTVMARTQEAAFAEAVNCAARLFLEYGCAVKVE